MSTKLNTDSADLRDALRSHGWSHCQVDLFIEKHSSIWLQALNQRLFEAVEHIDTAIFYLDLDFPPGFCLCLYKG